MNGRDIKIEEKIGRLLSQGKKILIMAENSSLTMINLYVLKYLSHVKKRVLIITIEKPHHYLTYLLGTHGISQRRFTYIDLTASREKRIVFPFKLGMLKNVVIGGFLWGDYLLMEDFDYILVDNMLVASNYLGADNFEKFARYIMNIGKDRDLGVILPVRKGDVEKFDFIEKMADTKIDFKEVYKS